MDAFPSSSLGLALAAGNQGLIQAFNFFLLRVDFASGKGPVACFVRL